jgi:hypothetical protein
MLIHKLITHHAQITDKHAHGRSLTNMFHHLDRGFGDEPGIEIVKAVRTLQLR